LLPGTEGAVGRQCETRRSNRVHRCFWCSAGLLEIGRAVAPGWEKSTCAVAGLPFVDFTLREPVFLDKVCPRSCRLSSLPGSQGVNSTTAISTTVFVEFSSFSQPCSLGQGRAHGYPCTRIRDDPQIKSDPGLTSPRPFSTAGLREQSCKPSAARSPSARPLSAGNKSEAPAQNCHAGANLETRHSIPAKRLVRIDRCRTQGR
jgi:hypothetical protein